MNVNPHLQYIQQQQQLQQQLHQNQTQGSVNTNIQSPSLAQIYPQQQLQLQQHQQPQQQHHQLLNHQVQQQQQTGSTGQNVVNPILATINGTSSNNRNTSVMAQSMNPALQLQLQQQQLLQMQHQVQQIQVPVIKEVWAHNLEHEFSNLRSLIKDNNSDIFVAVYEEIPGIVARPVGTFKSPSDYHFQTLRSNSDLLNIIQLSLCITKIGQTNDVPTSFIWQFNFLYDLTKEMYNEEHLAMLSQSAQINFQMTMSQGISHFKFAELLIESGLLLDSSINWITYHAGYDLGFLISILMNDNIPVDEEDFSWWCSKFFPSLFDLKLLGSVILESHNSQDGNNGNKSFNSNSVLGGNSQDLPNALSNSTETSKIGNSSNKSSIESLAEELNLSPISPVLRQYFASSNSHFPGQQASSMTSSLHAYLSSECFRELYRQIGLDKNTLSRYKGLIWGLGNTQHTGVKSSQKGVINSPATPINSIKGGAVHFGRAI